MMEMREEGEIRVHTLQFASNFSESFPPITRTDRM